MNYKEILEKAYAAATEAANAENARLGPESSRGFDCGFAWCDVETPRGAHSDTVKGFVKYCRENSKGDGGGNVRGSSHGSPRGYGKAAWQFWSPASASTQSVSVHYAGAAAFALVLRNAGIETAHAGQRLD